jgi:hypothetical protein
LGLGKRNKTFSAVVDGVECLAGNAIDCAKTVDDVIAVRDIPTTDMINANAATKLVIVTSLPHLVQSCRQECHLQKAYYKVLFQVRLICYYNLPIKLYIVKPSEFSTTLLYDPNKPATRLLGRDRYDDEGNCYKSGVLGKVPCNKPSPTNFQRRQQQH